MQVDQELPADWRWSTLGEACQLNPRRDNLNGISPETCVTFVPMPAVDATLGAITNAATRPLKDVCKGYTTFRTGDVIMAKITPCMENGKAAIVGDLENGLGFGSTEFHVLRPNGVALAEYLYHFIRQESFRKLAESNMTGSVGQRRVPADFLRDVPIPLPPLDEQRRIAAKLDDLVGRVAATRERLDRVPAILRRFRQSVLSAAVSGRLTGEENAAPLVSIADVAEIRGGIQKQPSRAPTANPRRYLTVAHVKRDWIDFDNPRYFEVSDEELERWRLRNGDVLVIEGNGSPSEIGRAALFRGELDDCVHQNHVIRIRPDSSGLRSEYLNLFLNSPQGQFEVQERSHTTAGLYSLSVGKIKEISVPLWPTSVQDDLVENANQLLRWADAALVRDQRTLKRVDNLGQSVLAKAFNGWL